jgi:glycerol kinase
MAANAWMLKFMADILGVPVERPRTMETAARGAAMLASLTIGLHPTLEAAARAWDRDLRLEPAINPDHRRALVAGWRKVVEKVKDSG